jgi:hypothetical protein
VATASAAASAALVLPNIQASLPCLIYSSGPI